MDIPFIPNLKHSSHEKAENQENSHSKNAFKEKEVGGVKESNVRGKVVVIQGYTTSMETNAQERPLALFFSYCFKLLLSLC